MDSLTSSEADLGNDTVLYRVPTADYGSFARLYFASASKYWRRYRHYYAADYVLPDSFVADLRAYCAVRLTDAALVFGVAVVWTLLRRALTRNYFMPLARRLRLEPASQTEKLPETLWKLGSYSCLWAVSLVVTVGSPARAQYFWDPLSVWETWHPTMPVDGPVSVAYMLQASFYLHCMYATIYMDRWRKDSVAMLVHHCLAISLIAFSYGCRHHQVGMLVLLLHDISDILLEVTKLNAYLKRRDGAQHPVNEWIANISFVVFAASWFYCRLYLYPLKVIYTASYGSVNMADHRYPFNPLFNGMLFMLLAMNVWWFHFILILFYRVATGTLKEVDDTREFEEGEVDNEKALADGHSVANGDLKKEN